MYSYTSCKKGVCYFLLLLYFPHTHTSPSTHTPTHTPHESGRDTLGSSSYSTSTSVDPPLRTKKHYPKTQLYSTNPKTMTLYKGRINQMNTHSFTRRMEGRNESQAKPNHKIMSAQETNKHTNTHADTQDEPTNERTKKGLCILHGVTF